MIEGSGSGSRAGSGSIPLTSGSGSGRPKNMWIRWIRNRIRIRIRITARIYVRTTNVFFLLKKIRGVPGRYRSVSTVSYQWAFSDLKRTEWYYEMLFTTLVPINKLPVPEVP
jgi:hypothetical protein